MRTMINETTGAKLNVKIHVITKNFWEYYLEGIDNQDRAFGLVCGHEDEMGYVDIDEIRPYVFSTTKILSDIAPAPGWEWLDNPES